MLAHELQTSAAVGQQPVQRGRTRPQRRRAEHERLLLDDLILVEQHHHQTGAAAEATEQRALADARGHGDVVGRDGVGAALGYQAASGIEEKYPVARGVASFLGRLVGDGQLVELTRGGHVISLGPGWSHFRSARNKSDRGPVTLCKYLGDN